MPLTCVAVDKTPQVSVGVSRRYVVAAVVQPVDFVVFDVATPLGLPVLARQGLVTLGRSKNHDRR